jgi:hypothetical protein
MTRFLDVEIRNCRYPAYELLRNEAPVWRDPLLDTTPSTS